MEKQQALDILKEAGALLSGHFLLTSGRHSDHYMQCARVFENPALASELCDELADLFRDDNVQLVAGPALGAITMAYETARALGVRNVFAERENGVMTLRRGFEIKPGERVLLVEDVITTGGSVREVRELIERAGGVVVGVGAIVDRSAGKVDFGVPLRAVLSMAIESYESTDCPLCRQGLPLVKPGSRAIKALRWEGDAYGGKAIVRKA